MTMLLDPSGRGPTAQRLGVAGVAVLALFALVLGLFTLRFQGAFDSAVRVVAIMTSTGDGLPARADVKFRGMLVGVVDSVDIAAKGKRQQVRMDLEPAAAQSIPGNVTARVVPANIFGVTALELLDNGPAPRGLRSGATIAEDAASATTELQTTLTTLRTVLAEIQPEKLGRVLGTLADALEPGARVPGSTIERLDHWITEVHAIPEIGGLLGDLGVAATAVSRSTPDLVDALNESVTAARTLVDRRTNLVALLTSAGTALDATNSLFARNPNSGKELVSGLNETFGALAADPDAIGVAMANLNTALSRLAGVFTYGPAEQMVWSIDVSFTPFRQYTAADCPRYGALAGPRCGSAPESTAPQEFPAQLLPRGNGEAPVAALPGLPSIPGLPAVPGLPSIPGLPFPFAPLPGAAQPAAGPITLSGPDALRALTGGTPNAAQAMLLTPLLADGSLTVAAHPAEGAR
ncbi:MCE family protein [Nocardia sp. NPDC005978]|uniref:MlaD family protein n=1 Tax=Nocardia sp. NPDC005978 TaxID=3156725 RepID=UPI0033B61457